MPKEVIYSADPEFVLDGEGNEILVPVDESDGPLSVPVVRRALHIGWTKDQHLEVGVCLIDISTGDRVFGSGQFLSLERTGTNRAVRALRLARNDVFGKDE